MAFKQAAVLLASLAAAGCREGAEVTLTRDPRGGLTVGVDKAGGGDACLTDASIAEPGSKPDTQPAWAVGRADLRACAHVFRVGGVTPGFEQRTNRPDRPRSVLLRGGERSRLQRRAAVRPEARRTDTLVAARSAGRLLTRTRRRQPIEPHGRGTAREPFVSLSSRSLLPTGHLRGRSGKRSPAGAAPRPRAIPPAPTALPNVEHEPISSVDEHSRRQR